MARIAFVNGRYRRQREARLPVEDRSVQFADAAYEVIWVENRRMVDRDAHLERLRLSLAALDIAMPRPGEALAAILHETARRNDLKSGHLYVHVSRGASARRHLPRESLRPALVVCAQHGHSLVAAGVAPGRSVRLVPDLRWRHCHIKSVALLANVLARRKAASVNADEAWFVREDGVVTEGAVSNAWMVDSDGSLRTHPEGERILSGVTRGVVAEVARKAGLPLREDAFGRLQLKAAREAFQTSTTQGVEPVVRVDGQAIGTGRVGAVTRRLAGAYLDYVRRQVAGGHGER